MHGKDSPSTTEAAESSRAATVRSRRAVLRAVPSAALPALSVLLGWGKAAAAPSATPALEAGLAAACAAAPVKLWWRNDDVGVEKPQFTRLLDMAQRRQVPVTLAVVPKILKPACALRILRYPQVTVAQHGIAHANNAATGQPVELGGDVDRALLAAQLRAGRERLEGSFGARFLPMQVPPWGRVAPDVAAMLPGLGFKALSTYGWSRAAGPAPGLPRINIQLDLYRWTAPRGPLSYDEVLVRLTGLVRAAKGEPIGILTHHSVMDDQAFAVLDRLLLLVRQIKAIWLSRLEELLAKGA
jgi:peptidoglycan/xylan/chitin deacetylase (PgdA/CDA1 family)